MTALPTALARWESELAWLPPSLVPAIGAMLPRLAQAIGPLARSKRDTGEPDGYGRIARRGPFDRLLASQWALLDEVPEDFLRRASSSELLFFELARSEPHGSQRSIAIFDAGPFSLGTPRIAHLALLLVLARRAAEVGVPFYWGTMREPSLRPFVGEASVRQLLAAHTPFRATDETFAAWNEALAVSIHASSTTNEVTARDDDLFVVGDAETIVRARDCLRARLGTIVHDDGIGATRDGLSLAIARPRQQARTVTLALPDEPTRVRLLRDPFHAPETVPVAPARAVVKTAPPWRAHVDRPLGDPAVVFSRDGQKVIARTAPGSVMALVLPQGDEPGRVLVRHVPAGSSIVAVGAMGRRLVRIVRAANGYLAAFELRGGSRDLDTVELRGRSSLGPPGELAALAVGVLSSAAQPIDLAARTRMGLALWANTGAEPTILAANAVVPIGSNAMGFAIARRVVEASDASRTLPIGYSFVGPHLDEQGAVLARAPDDTLVTLRSGPTEEGPLEHARASMLRPASPAFLGVLDVVTDGERSVVVTEAVEAPTLGTWIDRARAKRVRAPIAVAATLVRDLAEIVSSLSTAGLPPHARLRPDAVHVLADGRLRIGHALTFPSDRSDPEREPTDVDYVAPEQIVGATVTHRTDVFSLGLILHELVGDEHPAGLHRTIERLHAIRMGQLVDLDTRVSGLPPELHAIVRTATARDPEARFDSPHALREALDRFLAGSRSLASMEARIATFGLDEEPTTRRQVQTDWEIAMLRSGRDGVGAAERVAPALRAVVGGTNGGTGLFGFVEPTRVRVVSPARATAEQIVPVPAGADVIGVCAPGECVIRRGDAMEIRDRSGTVAAFPVPLGARLTMAPGWPHVAVTQRTGSLRVISLAERREVLVAGADA